MRKELSAVDSSSSRARYFGIDLMRFISMMAIVMMHSHGIVFFTDTIYFSYDQSVFLWLSPFGRFFSISGFTIVATTSFLYGRKSLGKMKRGLMWLLLAGIFLLFLFYGRANAHEGFFFEWDVYHLILVGFLAVRAAKPRPKILYALGIVGFSLLWVPFWRVQNHWDVSSWLKEILIGCCYPHGEHVANWPIFPWVGLIWFPYVLGHWVKNHRESFWPFGRGEWIGWGVLLLISIPNLGAYYHTPIGDNFPCHMFRQPVWVFWSHFIWILFGIRSSLTPGFQRSLESSAIARFISKLNWSRRFGLSYFIQLYLLLIIGFPFRDELQSHPVWFDVYWLSVIPVTEFLSRLSLFVFKKYKK